MKIHPPFPHNFNNVSLSLVSDKCSNGERCLLYEVLNILVKDSLEFLKDDSNENYP